MVPRSFRRVLMQSSRTESMVLRSFKRYPVWYPGKYGTQEFQDDFHEIEQNLKYGTQEFQEVPRKV